jgi:pimeloyl-ACP methyl ester carboxylesterase
MSDAVTLTHHTIALDDVRLHYVTAGSGDPVLLLHGWPQTWFEWRRVIPALASRYTVIAPDMRGIGDSSRPVGGYDKRTVANDIYQLVHKLGLEKIFLVGHDWSGPVAYAYACAHPAEVRKLVILDVTIPGGAWEKFPQITRRGGIWHLAFHSVRDLPEALVAGRERTYLFVVLSLRLLQPYRDYRRGDRRIRPMLFGARRDARRFRVLSRDFHRYRSQQGKRQNQAQDAGAGTRWGARFPQCSITLDARTRRKCPRGCG